MGSETVAESLVAEAKRRMLAESWERLRRCLYTLDEGDLWARPHERTNSVTNLVLHVCGNLRQWVVHGLGGAPDVRRRHEEFEARGGLTRDQLVERLDATMTEVRHVLDRLDPTDLLRVRRVQGFDENGVSVLLHAVEHTSYHTGQVAHITKATKAVDLGFYAGVDLDRK